MGCNAMSCVSILRLSEIDKGTELTASLVNTSVDLKFFPDAPVTKDTMNRVSSDLNTNLYVTNKKKQN